MMSRNCQTQETIAKAKTEIQHRILTHFLPWYFPEIERFRGNSRTDWFFAFLDAFPTPGSVMALSKEAFIEAAWDVVGRKVSKERLLANIYESARLLGCRCQSMRRPSACSVW